MFYKFTVGKVSSEEHPVPTEDQEPQEGAPRNAQGIHPLPPFSTVLVLLWDSPAPSQLISGNL